eukprot:snap_masked-scaffold_65-processed-gene-0.15-mRNA-1 protein AED:1.00 eAED:1.00 QI:0/0/0/0/1/1/4/0/65
MYGLTGAFPFIIHITYRSLYSTTKKFIKSLLKVFIVYDEKYNYSFKGSVLIVLSQWLLRMDRGFL